jgi:hypothetical protein
MQRISKILLRRVSCFFVIFVLQCRCAASASPSTSAAALPLEQTCLTATPSCSILADCFNSCVHAMEQQKPANQDEPEKAARTKRGKKRPRPPTSDDFVKVVPLRIQDDPTLPLQVWYCVRLAICSATRQCTAIGANLARAVNLRLVHNVLRK